MLLPVASSKRDSGGGSGGGGGETSRGGQTKAAISTFPSRAYTPGAAENPQKHTKQRPNPPLPPPPSTPPLHP